MEYSDEVTTTVISLPSPRDGTFLTRTRNPIREIDEAILSVGHKPVNWAFDASDNTPGTS